MENNEVLLIVGIVLLILIVFYGGGMMGFGVFGSRYGMMDGFYGGSGFIFGWIFMLVVLVALVLFIIWLIKQLQNDRKK